MTEQPDAIRSSIVAAVQQELNRFNQQVSAEVQRLQTELASERAARVKSDEAVRSLLPAIEQRLAEFSGQSKRRHDELDHRIGRVADEANVGLAAAVESAARPVVKQLEHRQAQLEQDLASVDRSVHKFDQQASLLVQHVNAMTAATEARLDDMSGQVAEQLDGRLASLAMRMDEVSAQAARQQAEVSNVVGARVDQAEERINDRIITAEARVNDTVGQRVADIDAYVGRVSAGLDDAVSMLSDRIAGTDARFADVNRSLDAMAGRLDSLDVDAIDEMRDRVGGLAGEVELVRIEVERFQKTMGDTMDKAVGRIVELETQLQENHMDVDTAIQLERLEEVERALLALDPSQFVRHDSAGVTPPTPAPSPLNPLSPPTPFAPQATAQI
jgi:predicted  nucleic acid-binding Zn-ribbon protein